MKKYWKYAVLSLSVVALSATTTVVTHRVLSSDTAGEDIPTEEVYGFKQARYRQVAEGIGGLPDLTAAAESSVHAVVHIKIEGRQQVDQQYVDPFEFFFGGGSRSFQRPQTRPVVGYGSGVIISTDGYIITNNHVIEKANEITVRLNDNRSFKAKLVGSDPATDIALIKVEAKNLPTIPFGNSDDLRLGEWVLAVGNPFNLTSTVTAGIVSAKARSTIAQGSRLQVESFIQTDAAVNPGNSGGALVNGKGELVGINTMLYSQTGNYAGYSFAVPISIASKVVADLKEYGTVQRAVMGIQCSDIEESLTEKYNLKVHNGAVVVGFADVSSALAAGIKEGDVITSIGGQKVVNMASMLDLLARHRPGDKVEIGVNRGGSVKKMFVTLKNTQGGVNILKPQDIDVLGASFEQIDEETRISYGISYGIRVENLSAGKMRQVGVRPGYILLSINNEPMRSPEDVRRIVSEVSNSKGRDRTLVIKGFYPSEGNIKYYTIELDKKP
ncbi:deoxyribonuclease HsdR [Porphyromonas crevioricanis]|uniref:Deoxyribonuclease HsdR n=2 Tax=Porphyromonas crevioricanis TaxID=393921 RepID=A0A0A2FSV2_9PORP|nr:Do family serine endopeptidase [Porphyromonas crevioricanis]KGN90032.1 deoxyribonuclease HsdR [Porphyromonas crevioricanis]KGN94211.1 deoxyribonuclease HsdR [Porphyromonas crevioricanis]SJZ68643.1 Do/DeqQ family serine protease [Porphyromonas crevioricanis]SQH72237.1 Probable periplasmic serine endoprotease DegP-like precursor [Porphyromonas crevioricanis]GAD04411.1 HtrA protease/chaperone protein [Porphyromonas crevioricanis JCM 15906]